MPIAAPSASPALAILGQADQLLDGWSCECSAECCDFALTGRTPYATEAEFTLIAEEIRRQGRKLPAEREDGRCPFLDGEKRCTIYAVRPLGCRTFYCDRASGFGAFPRREIARLPRELEDLSGGAKGKPLTRWLPRR